MGARRDGISLGVFNSIPLKWANAQWTSDMSNWTREEKFYIYKQPCIILFIKELRLNKPCGWLVLLFLADSDYWLNLFLPKLTFKETNQRANFEEVSKELRLSIWRKVS